MDDYYGGMLVRIARKAVENYVRTGSSIAPKGCPAAFSEKRGVFVTICKYPGKELRGCIGHPEATHPLIEALVNSAMYAARDPRFPPLNAAELGRVRIEVSVLTEPKLIDSGNPDRYPEEIEIGKDGLIIEKGKMRGLLLPQVAAELNWDQETFLGHLCIKANLTPDQWHAKGVRIYKFQAEIFAEEYPNGPVKRVDVSGGGK